MRAEDSRVRQSQLVSTFGVGSILPSGDQSYLVCGLDDWDDRWCVPVEEPRLAKSLGVHLFRAPSTGQKRGDIPVVRFPAFQYCPGCRSLDNYWKFDSRKMQCPDCVRELTPSRFVACCENGHLEDFPYFQWLHQAGDARAPQQDPADHRMTLVTRGTSSSLGDIVVKCSCGVTPRDLDGAFAKNAVAMVKSCGGRRPWLPGSEPELCDKNLRALQRGSSNVWFGAVRSSISIPPWSSPNARYVTRFWEVFRDQDDNQIRVAAAGSAARDRTIDVDGVLEVVAQRRGVEKGKVPTEADLRAEEYLALRDGNDAGSSDAFQCIEVEVAPDISHLVAQVSRVSRLREVRALHGFSRVTPTATDGTEPKLARLSSGPVNWLPAIEVYGEGVFIRIDEGWISDWESGKFATQRGRMLEDAIKLRASESGAPTVEVPTSRFLAVHTLAHAVLKELSLDAGYPVGALRERVYAERDQAGFLIYTASSDAAGSLGGLAALAAEEHFAKVLAAAASRAEWCSHDPVCSESGPSGSDGLNLAACHACLLLPETSCEHRNIYLDRVSLIGGEVHEGVGLLTGW